MKRSENQMWLRSIECVRAAREVGDALACPPGSLPSESDPLMATTRSRTTGVSPPINLTAHEDDTPLPCLCKQCFRPEVVRAQAEGTPFVLGQALAGDRLLYFWMPESL